MWTFFCYNGTGLSHDYFINELMGKKFQILDTLDNVKYVDFMWVEQINDRFDKKSYTVDTYAKNILNDVKLRITDKGALYDNMPEEVRNKHMAQSYTLFANGQYNKNLKWDNNKLVIIKPVGDGACSGKDIFIINTNETQEIKNILFRLTKRYKKVIMCDYINKVQLFKDKKFHLRMYLLVRMKTKTLPFFYSLHKTGKILTAKLPYYDGDYFNSDIHDTHVKSSDKDWFFPRDMPSDIDCKDIFSQIEKIGAACANIISDVQGFSETKIAFEVFGLDVLIDENKTAILLELNDKVGYGSVKGDYNADFVNFSNEYFDWVYKNAIKPLFDERLNTIT